MTTPFVCLTIAFVFLYLSKAPVGVAMARMPKGYDNRHPRDQQAQLVGWGRRALAAHQNGFENFPGFAAAVLVSHVGHGDPGWSAVLALTYVIARVAYTAAYIADVHALRSLLWTAGMLATVGLFLLPAFT
jgi:uncharacterized MAPEG superfamily protein